MEERMDRRIANLALARFRVGGFAGTSIADLAGALGVSKAAIYYHYRSKDALLHHLIDPLLDATDACIQDHTTPPPQPGPRDNSWTPTWPSCSPTARSWRWLSATSQCSTTPRSVHACARRISSWSPC